MYIIRDDVWIRGGMILLKYSVLPLENNKYCVTEYDKCFTVTFSETTTKCPCKLFQGTFGLCPHVIAVAEKNNVLETLVAKYTCFKV